MALDGSCLLALCVRHGDPGGPGYGRAMSDSVTLRSTIREKAADGAKSRDGLQTQEVEASGADYDSAYAALLEQVPEDWQLLGVARR